MRGFEVDAVDPERDRLDEDSRLEEVAEADLQLEGTCKVKERSQSDTEGAQ